MISLSVGTLGLRLTGTLRKEICGVWGHQPKWVGFSSWFPAPPERIASRTQLGPKIIPLPSAAGPEATLFARHPQRVDVSDSAKRLANVI